MYILIKIKLYVVTFINSLELSSYMLESNKIRSLATQEHDILCV